MTGLLEGLHPLGAGVLLYAVAWLLWRCCLSSARMCDPRAEARAEALLSELLAQRERDQLAEYGFLAVRSPSVAGRIYRIPSRTGWVEVYEQDSLIMKLCALPTEGLPPADVVLMHKLMIEGNEPEYLRSANVRWMRREPPMSECLVDEDSMPTKWEGKPS